MGLAVRRRPLRRRRRLVVLLTLSTAFLVLAQATPIFEPSASRSGRKEVAKSLAGGEGVLVDAEARPASTKRGQMDSVVWVNDGPAPFAARGTPVPVKDGTYPVANNVKHAALKSWDHGQLVSDLSPVPVTTPSQTPEIPLAKAAFPPGIAGNLSDPKSVPAASDALALTEQVDDQTDVASHNAANIVDGAKPKISYGGQHSSVGVAGGSKKSSATGGKVVTVPVDMPMPVPDLRKPGAGIGSAAGTLPGPVAVAAAPVVGQLAPVIPSPWGALLTSYGSTAGTDTSTTKSPQTGGAMNETMSAEGDDGGSSGSRGGGGADGGSSGAEGQQGESNGNGGPAGTATSAEGQNTPNTNANTDSTAASTAPPDAPDANPGPDAGSAAPKRGIFIENEDDDGFYFLSRRSRQLLDLPPDLEPSDADDGDDGGGEGGGSAVLDTVQRQKLERRRASMLAIRQLLTSRHHGQTVSKRSLLADQHHRPRRVERITIK
ncbi:hypothetical protein CF336_g595 [Tilletia laevis]|uniref:Uncharacterized protein n=3 Tax=Tilletia TaxID=13289 RepID=A0A177VG62_9BASI|nr:hypothetical protein CF336_g595 [Tilletia laevis]KAE8265815.1 hypothetical protein A4X03_0g21 [Tilletia caries]